MRMIRGAGYNLFTGCFDLVLITPQSAPHLLHAEQQAGNKLVIFISAHPAGHGTSRTQLVPQQSMTSYHDLEQHHTMGGFPRTHAPVTASASACRLPRSVTSCT
jgi:hypothetical protein